MSTGDFPQRDETDHHRIDALERRVAALEQQLRPTVMPALNFTQCLVCGMFAMTGNACVRADCPRSLSSRSYSASGTTPV